MNRLSIDLSNREHRNEKTKPATESHPLAAHASSTRPPGIGIRHGHWEVLLLDPFCHHKRHMIQTVCQYRNTGK